MKTNKDWQKRILSNEDFEQDQFKVETWEVFIFGLLIIAGIVFALRYI